MAYNNEPAWLTFQKDLIANARQYCGKRWAKQLGKHCHRAEVTFYKYKTGDSMLPLDVQLRLLDFIEKGKAGRRAEYYARLNPTPMELRSFGSPNFPLKRCNGVIPESICP